jgi:hypothetical protein
MKLESDSSPLPSAGVQVALVAICNTRTQGQASKYRAAVVLHTKVIVSSVADEKLVGRCLVMGLKGNCYDEKL